MTIHELTPDQCREVLGLATIARLACARDGQPYVVPVAVYFDPQDDCLYGFSTVGKKIDWMRENPKVCVEVERIIDKYRWSTVIVFGRYEEVGDSPGDRESRRRAMVLFEKRPQWWLPAAGKVAGDEHPIPVVYRVRIDRMTGRQASRPESD